MLVVEERPRAPNVDINEMLQLSQTNKVKGVVEVLAGSKRNSEAGSYVVCSENALLLTDLVNAMAFWRLCKSRKENPQKLTQLSSRSHPRHLENNNIFIRVSSTRLNEMM